MLVFIFLLGLIEGRGGGRHIGHKLRVGGEVGRYTRYSKVLTPYTEHWANNKTKEWYAGKKASPASCLSQSVTRLVSRELRLPKPLTSTTSTFSDTRLSSSAWPRGSPGRPSCGTRTAGSCSVIGTSM